MIDIYDLEHEFIFSHNPRSIRGINFGGGTIYSGPVLSNNEYTKISVDNFECQPILEAMLDFSLNQKYTLIQTAFRHTVRRSKVEIDHSRIFEYFKDDSRIVLLDFNTNRFNDSFSKFSHPDKIKISLDNFDEHACLIHHANRCVFLTEGDFRSHNYIPPLLGKDVISIAPKDVLSLPSSAIDFWNDNVFKFGGQIIPLEYEQLIKDIDGK